MSIVGNEATRLCVLERMFTEFQKQQAKHMDSEERAFADLQDAIERNSDATVAKMESLQAQHKEDYEDVVSEITKLLDKHYVSKTELSKELSGLRASLVTDITESKRTAYSDIARIFIGVMATLAFCGWFYTAILQKI